MRNLAVSPLAPWIGRHVPLRGPGRLLHSSRAKRPAQLGDYETTTQTRDGDKFSVDLASDLEWQLWAFGQYEPEIGELFSRIVEPGDLCIDVGANVGIHAVRLAQLVGPTGGVVAIEADEEICLRLRRNICLNDLSNVEVLQAAASVRGEGVAQLHKPDASDSNHGSGSLLPHSHLSGKVQSVPTVALDDIVSQPVALIKIDVEGYEDRVLLGAEQILRDAQPTIVMEYSPSLMTNEVIDVWQWLQVVGYELFCVSNHRHPFTGRDRLVVRKLTAPPRFHSNIMARSRRP